MEKIISSPGPSMAPLLALTSPRATGHVWLLIIRNGAHPSEMSSSAEFALNFEDFVQSIVLKKNLKISLILSMLVIH